MAFRRGKKRTYKRKTNTRKRVTYRNKSRVPRKVFNGIPATYRTKLHYVDVLTSTTTAGSYTYWIYQSSLFDPYYAAGGHQPYYFDQLAAIYSNYRVYGMSYNIDAQLLTSNSHATLVTYFNKDGLLGSSLSAVAERPASRFIGYSDQYRGRMKGYNTLKKVWNVPTKEIQIDDTFSAVCGANPAKLLYLFIQSFNPTAASQDVVITIKLTFYCEFFGTITQGQS